MEHAKVQSHLSVVPRFLFNCDEISEEQIRIQQRGSKVQSLATGIDTGDETAKIFRIYSFHRFYGRIRKALSSRAKALGTRQLCQMSFSVPANLIDCFVPLRPNISQLFSRLRVSLYRTCGSTVLQSPLRHYPQNRWARNITG